MQGEDLENEYREKIILAFCNFILKVQEITKGRDLHQEFLNVQNT